MRFLGKWWRFTVPRTLMVLLILASAMLLLLLQHGKLWRPSRGGAGQEGLGGKSAVDVAKDFLRIEADQVHHLRVMEEECQKHSGTGDIGRSMQELSPGRRQLLFRHLLVNDRYGFLYCYVPKVACSNWKRVIKVLSGSLPNVDVNVKMDHKKDLVFLSSFSPTEREYRLQHYYKFMFSREPLERLVSAYRNKLLEIPTFKQRYAPHIRRHWDQHYASKRNKRDVPLKELEKLQTLAENDKMHNNINVKSKLRPKAFAAGDHDSFHRASSRVGHSKANKTISDLHRATSRHRAGYMIPAEQSILEKPLSALHTGTNNIRSRYHISSPLNSHLIGEPVDNISSNLNLHQDPLNSPSLEDHPRFPRELVNQLTKPERDRASTPEVSFTQFLAYITNLIPAKHDEHWMSASMLCQPCAVRYNFLGRHVGLPEEADWVLQHVKAPTDVRFPKRQTWYKPVSAASAADEARRVPRAILRKALQMYAADYYLFGYNSSILHHWMV